MKSKKLDVDCNEVLDKIHNFYNVAFYSANSFITSGLSKGYTSVNKKMKVKLIYSHIKPYS